MFNYIKNISKTQQEQKATHRLVYDIYDPNTGESIKSVDIQFKIKQSKKGWTKMYKNDMREVLKILAKKPLAMQIWIELWDYMKRDGTLKPFKQKDIAKKINSKPESVSRAIKILKQENVIDKIDNEWRYNPFIFGVSGQSDIELKQAQDIWEKEIGHYDNFNK